MLHALLVEFAYIRSYLLGAFAIALGVVLLLSLIFVAVGDQGPPSHAAAGMRGMYFLMAPLIVGFIAQAFRLEERRNRMLLAGALSSRQLAAVSVLLPVILFAIGVVGATLMFTVEALVTGRFAVESLHIAGYVGGLLFMGTMIGLLTQEATAAHRQRRRRASAIGWASFAAGLLLLTALTVAVIFTQGPMSWPLLHLGNLMVASAAMAASVALYTGRTDFTR